MKKRLRRKLHRKHLLDVAYAVSLSTAWRRRLFAAPAGTVFPIDAASPPVGHRMTDRDIRRLDLRYAVCAGARPAADGDLVVFRFTAREFPQVRDRSWNNPAVP